MKKQLSENLSIPEGITCHVVDRKIICSKGGAEISRELDVKTISAEVKGNEIVISSRGNKKESKVIMSIIAHLKNTFEGLSNNFIYKLEVANVHFPMTMKVEGNRLLINNFLGEKLSRVAEILPHVKLDIKGALLTITSHDKEAAGQTAANIEKATKIVYKDRRIFQDGIYIVEKPGRRL